MAESISLKYGNGTLRKVNGGKAWYWRRKDIATGRIVERVVKDGSNKSVNDKAKALKIVFAQIKDMQYLDKLNTKEQVITELAINKKLITRHGFKVGEIWSEYKKSLTRPDSGRSTMTRYEAITSNFIKWLKKKYGNNIKVIEDVTEDMAKEYLAHLYSTGISNSTFNTYLQGLRLVWGTVLNDKNTIFSNIKRRKMKQESRSEFTKEQIKNIFDKLDDPTFHIINRDEMRVLLQLMLSTGCRGGMACQMKWSCVDFENRLLKYTPVKTETTTGSMVSVPVNDYLHDSLSSLHKDTEYILPKMQARYIANKSGISKDVIRLLEASGIQAKVEAGESIRRKKMKNGQKRMVTRYSMHSFRYSFVSFCANNNVPLHIVQELVSHSSPAMTRHYSKISNKSKEQATNTMNDILQGVNASTIVRPENEKILLDFIKDIAPDRLNDALKQIGKESRESNS